MRKGCNLVDPFGIESADSLLIERDRGKLLLSFSVCPGAAPGFKDWPSELDSPATCDCDFPKGKTTVGLDAGEAAALSLAVEIHADAILIDERRGHLIASELGLKTKGLLGILIQAKAKGLLPAVRPVLERLEGCPLTCASGSSGSLVNR